MFLTATNRLLLKMLLDLHVADFKFWGRVPHLYSRLQNQTSVAVPFWNVIFLTP